MTPEASAGLGREGCGGTWGLGNWIWSKARTQRDAGAPCESGKYAWQLGWEEVGGEDLLAGSLLESIPALCRAPKERGFVRGVARGARTRQLHPLEHPHPSSPRAPHRHPLHPRSGTAAPRAPAVATEGAKVIYIHVAALPTVTLLSAMHEYYLNTEFVVTILPRETGDLLWDGSPPSGCHSGGVSFSCLVGSRVPSKVRQWTLFLLLISMSNLLSEGPFVLDCSQDE